MFLAYLICKNSPFLSDKQELFGENISFCRLLAIEMFCCLSPFDVDSIRDVAELLGRYPK
jgi:hypothetical protein